MLPRIEPVTAPGGSGAGAGDHGGQGIDAGVLGRRLDASLAELEIDGLRPYREGAPASRIHWLSVARRGEMLERRLVAELDSAPLIVVDPSAPSGEEGLDKAVRAAASLCVHLAREGGCAVLLARGAAAHRDRTRHGRLARRARAPRPGRVRLAAARLDARSPRRRGDLGHGRRSAQRPAGARAPARPGLASWFRRPRCPGCAHCSRSPSCTGCLVERVRRMAPVGAGRAAA